MTGSRVVLFHNAETLRNMASSIVGALAARQSRGEGSSAVVKHSYNPLATIRRDSCRFATGQRGSSPARPYVKVFRRNEDGITRHLRVPPPRYARATESL